MMTAVARSATLKLDQHSTTRAGIAENRTSRGDGAAAGFDSATHACRLLRCQRIVRLKWALDCAAEASRVPVRRFVPGDEAGLRGRSGWRAWQSVTIAAAELAHKTAPEGDACGGSIGPRPSRRRIDTGRAVAGTFVFIRRRRAAATLVRRDADFRGLFGSGNFSPCVLSERCQKGRKVVSLPVVEHRRTVAWHAMIGIEPTGIGEPSREEICWPLGADARQIGTCKPVAAADFAQAMACQAAHGEEQLLAPSDGSISSFVCRWLVRLPRTSRDAGGTRRLAAVGLCRGFLRARQCGPET